MMPVNIQSLTGPRSRSAPDALVDFEPVDAKRPAVGQLPAAMGVGDALEANIADRRFALADQNGRPIDQQTVDQVGGEEGGGRGRAALDEQVVDVMKPEDLLGTAEPGPAFDCVAAGEQRTARRAVLEAGQAD